MSKTFRVAHSGKFIIIYIYIYVHRISTLLCHTFYIVYTLKTYIGSRIHIHFRFEIGRLVVYLFLFDLSAGYTTKHYLRKSYMCLDQIQFLGLMDTKLYLLQSCIIFDIFLLAYLFTQLNEQIVVFGCVFHLTTLSMCKEFEMRGEIPW